MREILEQLSDPMLSQKLLNQVIILAEQYKRKFGKEATIMEVCGSHTMALARSGINQMLKGHVRLISGPGCPVCVTDQKSIDAMIQLAEGEGRIICTFGDMIRVPGTKQTLLDAKESGSDIRVVYSPLDAVAIAEKHPNAEVIFLGIGFETTIPVLGAAIKLASDKKLTNFSLWMTTKLVEPVLRTLLETNEAQVDGLLLPGHVAITVGADHFRFLSDEFHVTGVIAGFEPVELLSSIHKMLKLLLDRYAIIENNYKSVVSDYGNPVAQQIMTTYFVPSDEAWRGIGVIPNSGLDIHPHYASYNAKLKFLVEVGEPRKTKCRCGDMIRGIASPVECSLFGKACTPLSPIGPCMVSSEGSCAAYYSYMREK